MKVLFTVLHLSSPNLMENYHNFVIFDYKVWTQQHFEPRLFWKKCRETENLLRITDDVVCRCGWSVIVVIKSVKTRFSDTVLLIKCLRVKFCLDKKKILEEEGLAATLFWKYLNHSSATSRPTLMSWSVPQFLRQG